jgi:hypothetical protein
MRPVTGMYFQIASNPIDYCFYHFPCAHTEYVNTSLDLVRFCMDAGQEHRFKPLRSKDSSESESDSNFQYSSVS